MSATGRKTNTPSGGAPKPAIDWTGGQSTGGAKNDVYGSSRSLPSLSGRSQKRKATKGGSLRKGEYGPTDSLPAYMDDKLLKQVRYVYTDQAKNERNASIHALDKP